MLAIAALVLYLIAGPAPGPLLLGVDPATWPARPWSLLTGHLVHAGPLHLQWDLLGLLLVGLVYEPLLRSRLWLVLLAGVLAIDVGLGLGMGGAWLERYCGLSGLINAVVGAGLLAAWRAGDRGGVCFGMLVIAKVAIEAISGDTLLTQIVWPPVPVAHLLGILSGAAVVAWPLGRGAGWSKRSLPRKVSPLAMQAWTARRCGGFRAFRHGPSVAP